MSRVYFGTIRFLLKAVCWSAVLNASELDKLLCQTVLGCEFDFAATSCAIDDLFMLVLCS